MNELSIEQKAKAYDGLIERLKDLKFAYRFSPLSDTIEDTFPELKESEDERMRRQTLKVLNYYKDEEKSEGRMPTEIDECIAWLEKQGEHANFRNKIQIGDKVTRNQDGVLVNLSQLKRVAKPAETEKGANGNEREIPNSVWSEEDEENRKNILYILNQLKGTAIYKEDKTAENCIDWLKSLKDRVQPQPKQEWSEEDEEEFQIAIDTLVEAGQRDSAHWLKSLKERYTWKPSGEQMKALTFACIKNAGIDKSSIKALYDLKEQLKQL